MNLTKEFNTAFGSTDRYRRIVENLHAGIYVADEAGTLVYVNQAFCALLGYNSKDELIGVNLPRHLYVHPEDRQKFLDKLSRVGFVRNYEIENRRKDGSTVILSVTGELIMDEFNQPAGVEGVVYDVTEQKRMIHRLKILEKVVEQATDQILITDKKGIIQYVNPAFERMTGYSLMEAMGLTPQILYSGRMPREFYERLWAVILSGHVFYGHIINRKKNRELYAADVMISPIVDECHQISHFVCTYHEAADWVEA